MPETKDDVVCEHGTAMDVHCCNCHSGFLFDVDSCVCVFEDDDPSTVPEGTGDTWGPPLRKPVGKPAMPETPCPWWIRWYHRRLRMSDLEHIWIGLLQTASTEAAVVRAWDAFLTRPGQEHWHCSCATETRQALRLVNFKLQSTEDGDA